MLEKILQSEQPDLLQPGPPRVRQRDQEGQPEALRGSEEVAQVREHGQVWMEPFLST